MFGSFVVDLTTRQKNLPVPGQTIIGSWFKMGPGGKGSNQAVAAHRAGADVKLITKLGRDPFANVALDFYRDEGIATEHILIDGENATGIALIMVDEISGQNQIVVVPAACMHVTDEDIEKSRPILESAKILLLQMEINLDALCKIIEIAHSAGTRTDPGVHTRPRSLRARSTIITFSAWSLSLARSAALVAAVPLIGRVSTSPWRTRR
jgi:ribokinase